jgi:hypothetical protein
MNRRRYRIEATKQTLKRLLDELMQLDLSHSFVQRVTCDVNEEYYYVVVIAPKEVHDALRKKPFGMDSIALSD